MVWSLALRSDDAKQDPVVYGPKFGQQRKENEKRKFGSAPPSSLIRWLLVLYEVGIRHRNSKGRHETLQHTCLGAIG